MYVDLGRSILVPRKDIMGIFDLDRTTYNIRAAEFVNRAEREGRMIVCTEDLPKAVVLTTRAVYLSQFSPSTLLRRVEGNSLE